MINPSVPGWIDKFFSEQKISEQKLVIESDSFYEALRNTGFVYGHIISLNTKLPIPIKGWFKEEVSKVALFNSLLEVYTVTKKDLNWNEFITESVSFYNEMHPEEFNLFKKLLPKNSPSLTLEKFIDERVQTNENIISKNFSHLVTNALLFIDVLAFRQYLIHGTIPEKYLKKIEETIVNIVTLALKVKTNKSQYDDLLIKLFEASIRYSKFSKNSNLSIETLELDFFTHELEKNYLIDMAGMALWNDGVLETNESYFLYQLAEALTVSDAFVNKSIQDTNLFISKHKKEIPYFNYSNPVKHFYDQTTQSVVTLIARNRTRLVKEIVQSKELMVLLAYSTSRDLDEKEKKKIKKQLLDICKS
ncbi:MAG: hypothetical protein RLY98_334, partial [Bacteroidota bacterium]